MNDMIQFVHCNYVTQVIAIVRTHLIQLIHPVLSRWMNSGCESAAEKVPDVLPLDECGEGHEATDDRVKNQKNAPRRC